MRKLEFRPSKPIVVKPAETNPTEEEPSKDEPIPAVTRKTQATEDGPKKEDGGKRKRSSPSGSTKSSPESKKVALEPSPSSKASATAAADKKSPVKENSKDVSKPKEDVAEVQQALSKAKTFGSGFSTTLANSTTSSTAVFGSSTTSVTSANDASSSETKSGSAFAALATRASTTGFSDLLAQKETSGAADETSANNKQQKEEVELFTGEESDVPIKKAFAELKIFNSTEKEWKHRGYGPLHLNLIPSHSADKPVRARLVMRRRGTLGLILNVMLFEGMQMRQAGEQSVVFGAIEEGKIVQYAIKYDNKDTALDWLEYVKKASTAEGALEYLQTVDYNLVSLHEPTDYTGQDAAKAEGDNADQEESAPPSGGEFDEYVPPKHD